MTNANGNGTRLQQITERTLLPLGLVVGLVGGGIYIGAKIERFATLEAEVAGHETRIKMAETRLELWRRRVESALQIQLPDPEPASKPPEPADPPPPAPKVAFGALGTPPPGNEPGG